MPRPGDIPDDIHNKVKIYSIDNDLKVPKAYEQLLRAGLLHEEYIEEETHDKLKKFCNSNDLSLFEAMENIIDGTLDEEGELKQGTIIKNVSIQNLTR